MKAPIIIGVSATVVSLLGMVTYLIATDHDPTAFVIAATALTPGVAALFGIAQVNTAVKKVDAQTNGTLSALRIENSQVRQENSQLRTVMPASVASTIPVTPSVIGVHDPELPVTILNTTPQSLPTE